MAIYLSAGHSNSDPGAVSNGFKESDLTKQLRDTILPHLQARDARVIKDLDSESLKQYIDRIKPGTGSILCDLHFNAGPPTANGIEVLVSNDAKNTERELAMEICAAGSKICGLRNRGVKTESQSARGKLGLLHTAAGISVLVEVCFISNRDDLGKYLDNINPFAAEIARLLVKYDAVYA